MEKLVTKFEKLIRLTSMKSNYAYKLTPEQSEEVTNLYEGFLKIFTFIDDFRSNK